MRSFFTKWGLLFVLSSLGYLIMGKTAEAVSFFDPSSTFGLTSIDLIAFIIAVVQWILGLLALIAVIILMYGGFVYMTAAGNRDKIDKAKRIIANALVGLAIILLAWAIVALIFDIIEAASGAGGGPGGPGGPGPGGGPGEVPPFYIVNITTACGDPTNTYRLDVYRCSAIAINFNKNLDATTFKSMATDTPYPLNTPIPDTDLNIRIERCSGNNETDCKNIAIPGDGTATEVRNAKYVGDARSGNGPQWVIYGKSLIFYHPGDSFLFQPNQWYRIVLPQETIKSTDNFELEDERVCTAMKVQAADQCSYEDDNNDATDDSYLWAFFVGNKMDTEEPVVQSSIPLLSTDPNYPSQNITLRHILAYYFNEALDPVTVRNTNTTITPINMSQYDQSELRDPMKDDITPNPGCDPGNTFGIARTEEFGCQLDAPNALDPGPVDVDPATGDYHVTLSGNGRDVYITFNIDLIPFQWYEITVQNFEDLCQNVMGPVTIRFQTNNVKPGVAWVSPPDTYPVACPNINVELGFTVSMFDPDTGSCQPGSSFVEDTPSAKSIIRHAITGNIPNKILQIVPADDYPGVGDPNDFCKWYRFDTDSSKDLPENSDYSTGIQTKMIIDAEQNIMTYGSTPPLPSPPTIVSPYPKWDFHVTEPGACVNPPVVTRVDPIEGPKGQCFTVFGHDFAESRPGASKVNLKDTGGNNKTADIPSPNNWHGTYITGLIPDPISQDIQNVRVDVDWSAMYPSIGVVPSNDNFTFNVRPGTFNGPCLYTIDPTSAPVEATLFMTGVRFKDEADTVTQNELYQSGGTYTEAHLDNGTWHDTYIEQAAIADSIAPVQPNTERGATVKVENDVGRSNAVPFTARVPIPGEPFIGAHWPICSEACINSEPVAQFTLTMDAPSVNNTTVRFYKCNANDCSATNLTPKAVTLNFGANPALDIHPNALLEPDTWYRVYINKEAKSQGWLVNLGGLNFDLLDGLGNISPDGSLDGYSWVFKTRNNSDLCDLAGIDVRPPSQTLTSQGSVGYTNWAYGDNPACDVGQNTIDPSPYDFTWNTTDPDSAIASFTPDAAPNEHNAAVTSSNLEGPRTATLQSRVVAEGVSDTATFTLNIDPLACVADTDCVTVDDNNQPCLSTCDINTHTCRPVITHLETFDNSAATPRLDRAIGDWVTIGGCFFGNQISPDNKVFYSDSSGNQTVLGEWPSVPQCQNALWSNTKIQSEVPTNSTPQTADDARQGRLKVQRAPGTNPSDFVTSVREISIEPTPNPGICFVDPASGYFNNPPVAINIWGQHFKHTQGPGQIGFKGKVTDPLTPATNYDNWEDSNITTYVPLGTTISDPNNGTVDGRVRVTTADGQDEEPFEVVPVWCGCNPTGGSPTCQELGAPGNYACSVNGTSCCFARPTVSFPSTPFCPNGIIEATFSDRLDPGSVQQAHILLKKGVTDVPFTFQLTNNDQTIQIIPNSQLDFDTDFILTLKADNPATPDIDGIITHTGVSLASDATWPFHTKTEPCEIERVKVDRYKVTYDENSNTYSGAWEQDSYFDQYMCYGNDCKDDAGKVGAPYPEIAGNQHGYQGQALAVDGTPLTAAYTWQFIPKSADPVLENPNPANNFRTQVINKNFEGFGLVIVTATGAGEKSAAIEVYSRPCEHPWTGYRDADYKYDLFYCRGNDPTDLLPNLNSDRQDFPYHGIGDPNNPPKDELLRQLFFYHPDPNQKGAVGLRLYENEERLTPQEWFQKNVPPERQGGISATMVDGYPAISSGTSWYIFFPNVDDNNNGNGVWNDPYVNIMVISYPSDAPSYIVNIFNQMLKYILYVYHANEFGACTNAPTYKTARECILRDTYRTMDMGQMAELLRNYHEKSNSTPGLRTFPELAAGSYYQGYSISQWPSWNSPLGNELGYALPSDPLRATMNPPFSPTCQNANANLDPNTCYYDGRNNPNDRLFICPTAAPNVAPDDSHIYLYHFVDKNNAELYGNFEFRHRKGWASDPLMTFNPCNGLPGSASTRCGCFNYKQQVTP